MEPFRGPGSESRECGPTGPGLYLFALRRDDVWAFRSRTRAALAAAVYSAISCPPLRRLYIAVPSLWRGVFQSPQLVLVFCETMSPRDTPPTLITGGVFSEPSFFSGPCPADPIRAHTRPGITQGLCGWLGASGTQDLRALRLWQSSRQWRAPA